MSRENVELVRSILDRWRAGNTALDAIDAGIVWDSSDFPDGQIYHGHEGVMTFLRRWLGTWDDYRLELDELIDAGDVVVVVAFTRERGRGKGSAVQMEAETAMLFSVRDGKVVHFRGLFDRSAALKAAGLET